MTGSTFAVLLLALEYLTFNLCGLYAVPWGRHGT